MTELLQFHQEACMEDDFDFGKNLERLILERFSSIASFARAINKNPKTVQEWCGQGGRFPSKPQDIKVISCALRISVHELWFGSSENLSAFEIQDLIESAFKRTFVHTALYEISIKRVHLKESSSNKGSTPL